MPTDCKVAVRILTISLHKYAKILQYGNTVDKITEV